MASPRIDRLLTVVVLAAGVALARPAIVGARGAGSPQQRTAATAFDVRLYESYVRRHHRAEIPYRDRTGHITPFARAWMSHRKLCGGALAAVSTNPTTLSNLQEWQGCTAVQHIGDRVIRFHAAKWVR